MHKLINPDIEFITKDKPVKATVIIAKKVHFLVGFSPYFTNLT